ncbi:MAG: hypothetical protein IID44_10165 [Planctomycetes bacterium]|nr:hypothetical protein [Planctomycetota bacterium]
MTTIAADEDTMPAEYSKMGARFSYPENWTLDTDELNEKGNSITVYSPGGGFWSLGVHPAGTNAGQLAAEALEAMGEEYEHLESREISETNAEDIMVGYDLNFFYLDLTSTAKIRCVSRSGATYAIFCQAEDREFEQIGEVFRAITASLLYE